MTDRARGFDASHWQRSWSGAEAARAFDFAALKATQGSGYVDPTFHARRAQMRPYLGSGISALILYHFLDTSSPAAQAGHFLRTVGALQPGELLALDWESSALSRPDVLAAVWRTCLGHGPKLLVYASESEVSRVRAICPGARIWAARWGSTPPAGTWDFWQYSYTGRALGQALDLDRFNGTAEALAAYSGLSKSPAGGDDDVALTKDEQNRIAAAGSFVENLARAYGVDVSYGEPWVAELVDKMTAEREATAQKLDEILHAVTT